jgi:hypothetical protein
MQDSWSLLKDFFEDTLKIAIKSNIGDDDDGQAKSILEKYKPCGFVL